jgi:phosphoribosylglycinamide formyltransferase-1
MSKIVVFASGSGTNAEKVIEYLNKSVEKKVSAVFSNKKNAGVIARSERLNVPVYEFDRADFYETGRVGELLEREDPDLIVLAGFLWLVPGEMIKKYKGRIINIHPALLPKYGGKGMYGMHVHKAVIENKEKESGISIHYVNEKYDEGDIIFQARCKVEPNDTPESLAERIHLLEHRHFPEVISDLLDKRERT